ncbi:MAG: HAD-IA family hydrolase [Anaerolineae bacterium]|jgi:beta-phosphoglucomutase
MNTEYRFDMVIFDAGGTLFGLTDPAPFQRFLAQAGLPASDEDAEGFHRRLISIIVALRDQAQGLGAEGAELNRWWRTIFRQAWPGRSDVAEEMLRWLHAGRFDCLFADVMPALEALQDLGMPMAVLSNFDTHLYDILNRLDLRRFFEFVVVSAEVGLAKPDSRIFDLVADRANRPPQRLLYVGDHVGDDIEGAQEAGFDAVLIDRRNRQPEVLCPRIGNLSELVDYVQSPKRPARAILFDMDGVVLNSPPVHLLTWQQTLAPWGIKVTAEDLYPLEGMPTERTAQRLTEHFLGHACSDEQAHDLAHTKRALFREIFNPTLVPGIAPLLYDLRGRGYRLGLVTGSAGSVVNESLSPTGLAVLFAAIVTGDEVSQGKPDPEPYRTAADRLGLPSSECLVVENAPLGIRSAKAAGMGCVALETTLPATRLLAAAADRVFPDAAALRAWLLSK